MKKNILYSLICILLLCATYIGGYFHGQHIERLEGEAATLDAVFWSELTNMQDVGSALCELERSDNVEVYDELSRSYCRSLMNIIVIRDEVNPEHWHMERFDQLLSANKKFLETNRSVLKFINNLSSDDGVVATHRKETYINLLKDLKIEAEQDVALDSL